MSKTYDHAAIEEKWQQYWEDQQFFLDTAKGELKNKLYLLFAFAYPSGSGLHVGHVESKTALDILARFYRMNGKDVFFPVGWDAFGLPAENYAIKTGVPPAVTTKNAINTFRKQIKRLGISYDWANEIATMHPEYYRWTQWIFAELYKKSLAYQKLGKVNWCPSCQTVLANEQVVNGKCERCGTEVVQKDMKQWYFQITKYQDELISGLEKVDWPAATKQQQLNWIGKGKGLSIDFKIQGLDLSLTVWTKFWETIFGTTFLVIAPEKFEELGLEKFVSNNLKKEVLEYLKQTKRKTEEQRKIGEKEKTGVNTGLLMVNPVNGELVPLFVADYVLLGVGTAVVMGVPAHDERDFIFAKKFNLPIKQVVSYADLNINAKVKASEMPYEGEGTLVNSGKFDGQSAWGDGKAKMAEWMIDEEFAKWQTTYKLRDWLISRQRYWGAPIPVVYDPDGKTHLVKAEHLPWLLPTDVDFKPTGESPLKSSQELKARVEKLYGPGWTPEYDTMDTFVDSSWYFLRYTDSRNKAEFASAEQLQKLLPVDFYVIGPEHIVLHLLYARFFTKFLKDQGYLNFDEPFLKMRHQGMILGPDGKKMSKSKGNVINPDEIINKFGADTLRVYEMFMGPIEADKPWDLSSVAGIYRFLKRIYTLSQEKVGQKTSQDLLKKLNQLIKKASLNIPELKFNTVIARIMELTNLWSQAGQEMSGGDLEKLVKILAVFAPFLAEEIYFALAPNKSKSVHLEKWPQWDETLAIEEEIVIPIQVNGKVRSEIKLAREQIEDKSLVLGLAKEDEKIQAWLQGKKVVKEIYVPGKIVNLVI